MWDCYRLVIEGFVTWADLETMSLDDVDLLCITIDAYRSAQRGSR